MTNTNLNTSTAIPAPAATAQPDFKTVLKTARAHVKAWEKAQITTNKMFYDVMAEVLSIAENYSPAVLAAELKERLGIKTTAKTSKYLMAAKLVFMANKNDRAGEQKCSARAKVLELGVAAGQTSATIATWIDLGGGVEGIRRKEANDAAAKKEAEEKAKQEAIDAATQNAAPIPMPADAVNADLAISEKPQAENAETALKRGKGFIEKNPGGFALARDVVTTVPYEDLFGSNEVWLVRKEADGTRVVVMMTNDNALLSDAMAHLGTTLDKPNTRGTIIAARAIEAHHKAMEALGGNAE